MKNLIQLVIQKWGFTASRQVRSREALLLSTSAMMAMLLVGCSGGSGTTANTAPLVEASSFTLDEDNSIDINLLATDQEGDDLHFSLDADATNGSVSLTGNIATYTPNENYHGSDSFSFSVFDGSLSSASTVSLTINAVNDMPTGLVTITGTPKVGQALRVSENLEDPDGMGEVSYTWYVRSDDQTDRAITIGPILQLEASHLGKKIVVLADYKDGDDAVVIVESAVFEVPGYFQDFNGFEDGAKELGDGTKIASGKKKSDNKGGYDFASSNVAKVSVDEGNNDGRLQLTSNSENLTHSSFSIPAIEGSSNGFKITFDYMISSGSDPADGFSVNYGNAELGELGFGEMGMLSSSDNISFRVKVWGDTGVYISGKSGDESLGELAFTKGKILSSNSEANGKVEVIWDPTHGASFNTTGLNTDANFNNIKIPNFPGSDEHTFIITARTGGLKKDLFIDNLSIELGSFGDIG